MVVWFFSVLFLSSMHFFCMLNRFLSPCDACSNSIPSFMVFAKLSKLQIGVVWNKCLRKYWNQLSFSLPWGGGVSYRVKNVFYKWVLNYFSSFSHSLWTFSLHIVDVSQEIHIGLIFAIRPVVIFGSSVKSKLWKPNPMKYRFFDKLAVF